MSKPTCLLMIGMAGSGKTSFVQRVCSELRKSDQTGYFINLDPAVAKVPYPANIDIRDSVDYKEVMQHYNLGPNGAILTCMNLFTTKFGQVLDLIDKRTCASSESSESPPLDHVVIDTPGQIEIFTWSASGSIITESLAATRPTICVYIIDASKTTSATTFMSNMLYACSILYKTRLPFIVVLNKNDLHDTAYAQEWMQDFETFHAAIHQQQQQEDEDQSSSYMTSLVTSMSLVLEEFYRHLRVVSCSAVTGDGMDSFFSAVEEAAAEYETEYRVEMEAFASKRRTDSDRNKQQSLHRLMNDMNLQDEQQQN